MDNASQQQRVKQVENFRCHEPNILRTRHHKNSHFREAQNTIRHLCYNFVF